MSKLTKPQKGRVDRTEERIAKMLAKLSDHEVHESPEGEFMGHYTDSDYGRRIVVVVKVVEMTIDISARRTDR